MSTEGDHCADAALGEAEGLVLICQAHRVQACRKDKQNHHQRDDGTNNQETDAGLVAEGAGFGTPANEHAGENDYGYCQTCEGSWSRE